jgi:glycolate oxidase FAD binding subunit
VEGAGRLRAWLGERQGFLTVLEGAGTLEPWGYAGGALGLMRSVKDKFDPKGIFSPGRFVGGI